jgi:hypothetical protein
MLQRDPTVWTILQQQPHWTHQDLFDALVSSYRDLYKSIYGVRINPNYDPEESLDVRIEQVAFEMKSLSEEGEAYWEQEKDYEYQQIKKRRKLTASERKRFKAQIEEEEFWIGVYTAPFKTRMEEIATLS